MGKWCEVKCNCLNRQRLPGSDFLNYSDYIKFVKKPRLAKTLDEWATKVKNMYECGHRDGAFIEFWPGDIMKFGYALESAFRDEPERFELFRRIANFRCYEDEYLALSPADAQLWQLEIEELKKLLNGEIFRGWHQKETLDKELATVEFLYGDTDSTLSDAEELCEASTVTGNPIEFLW